MSAESHLQWHELKGDHFIVYYTEEASLAEAVAIQAEMYYNRIASDLDYTRYSNFWTWDHRVKIYIYPNKESYLEDTGQPLWSDGSADYNQKRISGYAHHKRFLEELLPHEIAHLIFRDFVGFKGEVPLWLEEGVAQWSEPAKRALIKSTARQLLREERLLSLRELLDLDVRTVSKEDSFRFHSINKQGYKGRLVELRGDQIVQAYYKQSASLVTFLIEHYGAGLFAEFCRRLRDGSSLDKAFTVLDPVRGPGIEDLERQWLTYLGMDK